LNLQQSYPFDFTKPTINAGIISILHFTTFQPPRGTAVLAQEFKAYYTSILSAGLFSTLRLGSLAACIVQQQRCWPKNGYRLPGCHQPHRPPAGAAWPIFSGPVSPRFPVRAP
jgi:hypothetical protein